MSMVNAALRYARKGWPVFPIDPNRPDASGVIKGKSPYKFSQGVDEATTNESQIRRWWKRWPEAQIGFHVGDAGMMVVDLDPGHDLKQLEKVAGKLPKTALRVKTPRGGLHLYFSLDNNEQIGNRSFKDVDNIDVRSTGGYVLLPPSRTPDGQYKWQAGGKAARRTDGMLQALTARRERQENWEEWIIEPDLDENLVAAKRWLSGRKVYSLPVAEIAIQGKNGDDCAYKTAAMCRSFGLSEESAFEYMLEYWNPRCDPPWSEGELEHLEAKVRHAYTYPTSAPGNVTKAFRKAKRIAQGMRPVEDHIVDGGRTLQYGRFEFRDYTALLQIEPPTWLVKNLIPESSYCLLYGAPQAFKTFVTLDIALSVAMPPDRSNEWLQVMEQGPVLYCAGEASRGVRNRVEAWAKEFTEKKTVNDFFLVRQVPTVDEELEDFIEGAQKMSDGRQYKLVVIDTVSRAMQGVNENAQENASALTGMCEAISKELGAAVLAIHHINKSGDLRGSSVLDGDIDVKIRLDRLDQGLQTKLTVEKLKDAENETEPTIVKLKQVTLSEDIKTLVFAGSAQDNRQGELPIDDRRRKRKSVESKDEQDKKLSTKEKLTLSLLDKITMEILSKDRNKRWTQAALANAVATHEKCSVASKSLRNRWLTLLRESKDDKLKSAACFNAFVSQKQGQWSHSYKP